uniref:Uncharacterized protein n=1 Tax=Colobus angolensis palliatus TaxID=336983 RepID=A0A2K5JCH7_COLAP
MLRWASSLCLPVSSLSHAPAICSSSQLPRHASRPHPWAFVFRVPSSRGVRVHGPPVPGRSRSLSPRPGAFAFTVPPLRSHPLSPPSPGVRVHCPLIPGRSRSLSPPSLGVHVHGPLIPGRSRSLSPPSLAVCVHCPPIPGRLCSRSPCPQAFVFTVLSSPSTCVFCPLTLRRLCLLSSSPHILLPVELPYLWNSSSSLGPPVGPISSWKTFSPQDSVRPLLCALHCLTVAVLA